MHSRHFDSFGATSVQGPSWVKGAPVRLSCANGGFTAGLLKDVSCFGTTVSLLAGSLLLLVFFLSLLLASETLSNSDEFAGDGQGLSLDCLAMDGLLGFSSFLLLLDVGAGDLREGVGDVEDSLREPCRIQN